MRKPQQLIDHTWRYQLTVKLQEALDLIPEDAVVHWRVRADIKSAFKFWLWYGVENQKEGY